ncbi:tyrosine-type recombinase/integrase [Leisingera aquimarina]|uniref:tyrosine-type recombinase/integrase n=1 Tax=Leisingera aquimarina TaxID=476529 RepID=UPI000417370D|nr:tyrosine-type recombinase/integrase [Leisingera aquimarina]
MDAFTLNKFLRQNKLTPTEEHTTYSLRHSFGDRLLTAGVDERVRRDLMGHRLTREEYGDGGGLKLRHKAILSIAL